MERQFRNRQLGEELGTLGAERTLEVAEQCTAHEKRYIEVTNRPRIAALRAELALLVDREQNLAERVSQATPIEALRRRRLKAPYYWAVTLVLTVSGFVFCLMSFQPFRLGRIAILFCAGIAVLTPFSMERFLAPEKERVVTILAAIAFLAALTSGILLATVRGNLLMQAIRNTAPSVTIEGDAPTAPAEPIDPFYDQTLVLVSIVFGLVALGMDLSAGLALREALRAGDESGEDPIALSAELDNVHQAMIADLAELTALENEAEAFEAGFWVDFYRALLKRTARDAMSKLLVLTLALMIVLPYRAFAEGRLNLIVLVDLSKSVDVRGPDGKTAYEENLTAMTRILGQLPAGAHVTIIGITSHSFAEPYILLSAELGTDEGYFKERIASARKELMQSWEKRSSHLEHSFPHTDILGALVLASQVFHERRSPGRNVIVIFSDMRQSTSELNMEAAATIDPVAAINTVAKDGLASNLRGVEVYVAAADNTGRERRYWDRLRDFWVAYFTVAGANLKEYSVMRGVNPF